MKLQPMPESGKIAQNGAYDVPIELYHSQLCTGPSISSSGLRRLINSPAKYWMTSDLNPNRVEEKENEALILGRAAHHLLLGEKDFKSKFIVQPETLYGEKWNGNRLDCKAWKKEHQEQGLTILTAGQIETIKGLAGIQPWQKNMPNCGLRNCDLVMKSGALNGAIETSLIWKEGKTWLKSRPDAIPGASNDFTDLKTASSIDEHTLSSGLAELEYFVQGALVGLGMSRVAGRTMEGFHLVYVDKTPPHAVTVRTLVDEDLVRGERAIFLGLKVFERCLETGLWPGPTADETDARKLHVPTWARERFDRNLDRLEKEYAP
jgi:hypothetical protein